MKVKDLVVGECYYIARRRKYSPTSEEIGRVLDPHVWIQSTLFELHGHYRVQVQWLPSGEIETVLPQQILRWVPLRYARNVPPPSGIPSSPPSD